VLIILATFMLWRLSVWIALRLVRPRGRAEVTAQLRSDATVPMARLRRDRPPLYPVRDRSLTERVVTAELWSTSRAHVVALTLATLGALPPPARLDVGLLVRRCAGRAGRDPPANVARRVAARRAVRSVLRGGGHHHGAFGPQQHA